jgi:mono/diheme cytochrome c family protein
MEMKSREDRTSRGLVVLGGLLVFSLFVNLILVWQLAATEPGYRIPAGDPEQGELAFEELNCIRCHTVQGVDRFAVDRPDEYGLTVALGGKVNRVKTYGELITAIVHPSGYIRPDIRRMYDLPEGESPMPDYSTAMTTGQLRDLASFLEQHYEVRMPEPPVNYSPYGP